MMHVNDCYILYNIVQHCKLLSLLQTINNLHFMHSKSTVPQAAGKTVSELPGITGVDYLINNAALSNSNQSRLE